MLMKAARWTILSTILLAVNAQSATAETSAKYRPVVVWHGMGDSCCNPRSMGAVSKAIEAELPGVYIYSIHVGITRADSRAGFFGNVNDQVDQVCQQLRQDPKLQGGFNAIGFSQGGQFLRAYIQRCNSPPVHRLITFGSQHAGVSDIPNCANKNDFVCNTARSIARRGAYLPSVRASIVQAQYFKDPTQLDAYLQNNIFLPDINNEQNLKNETYKRNLASLDKFVLVRFVKDTMVEPKETAWFWFYNEHMELIPLRQQPVYTEDWLGLKQLDERGALEFLDADGAHMQIGLEYLRTKIVKEYLSETIDGAAQENRLIIQQ